jgi:UrcA family protein
MQPAVSLPSLGTVFEELNPKEIVMKTMAKTRIARFVLATGFCAFSFAASAREPLADQEQSTVAAPGDKHVTYPVRYAGTDVSTSRGVKSLYTRIRYAAILVCRKDVAWSKRDGNACLQAAIDSAVAAVNALLLSQYAQLRGERDKPASEKLAKTN